MGLEEIGPVNKGGMDLLNFSLIWWEGGRLSDSALYGRGRRGMLCGRRGWLGRGGLAETFFDLHIAFVIKSKCHLIFPPL